MTSFDLDATRFWARVQRGDGCWLWTGVRLPSGYGHFSGYKDGQRKTFYAHRVALELTEGRVLGSGEQSCHRCDNPPCCRPDHLFRGTVVDNAHDRISKGRQASGSAVANKGAANGRSKLTPDQVAEIRSVYASASRGQRVRRGTVKTLADRFGISERMVNLITRGDNWK